MGKKNANAADKAVFETRLNKYYDELKWTYNQLYPDSEEHFEKLLKHLKKAYAQRDTYLHELDTVRENDLNWYKSRKFLSMAMYVHCFSGTLKNFAKRLPYLAESNINCVHLKGIIKSLKDKNDGEFAISDFKAMEKSLGDVKDLAKLAEKCHKKDINVCVDLVLNQTSDEHDWAMRACDGESEYEDRYYFYKRDDLPEIINEDGKRVQTVAGNFTYVKSVDKYVRSTFHDFTWDLNYHNPEVFNEMAENLLFLANVGVDIVRLDYMAYIWKQKNSAHYNLPQVHNILRMLRIISEIVCPGVILLGEVALSPDRVAPYFGSEEKPECHLVYDASTMAVIWHSVATGNVALLKHQFDMLASLPKAEVFQNSLRDSDEIKWVLDFDFLAQQGMQKAPHQQFLNNFFAGEFDGSFALGKKYEAEGNEDDAHICGTVASLCGIEFYDKQKDKAKVELAIDLDIMLHALMLSQSGIPTICSGDEVGQCSDFKFKKDDLRYLKRDKFNWHKAGRRKTEKAMQANIYQSLLKLETIRNTYNVFAQDAEMRTLLTWDESTLAIVRETAGEKFIGVYNFSAQEHPAWIKEDDGDYIDLYSGDTHIKAVDMQLAPYSFKWLWREK